MKKRRLSSMATALVAAGLVAGGGGYALAAPGDPMTPEMAARMEMVRKQREQRITPEKRKAAAEALKAERIKVYQAKQARLNSKPARDENHPSSR